MIIAYSRTAKTLNTTGFYCEYNKYLGYCISNIVNFISALRRLRYIYTYTGLGSMCPDQYVEYDPTARRLIKTPAVQVCSEIT